MCTHHEAELTSDGEDGLPRVPQEEDKENAITIARGKTRRPLVMNQPEREPLHVVQQVRSPSPHQRRTHGQWSRPPYKSRGVPRQERPRAPKVIPDRNPPRADVSVDLINPVNDLVQEVQTVGQQMRREVATMRDTLRNESREKQTLRDPSSATPLEARRPGPALVRRSQPVEHPPPVQGRSIPRSRSEGYELAPADHSASHNCERCHSCHSHGYSPDYRRRSDPTENSRARLDGFSPIALKQVWATQQIPFDTGTYQRRRQAPSTLDIEHRPMTDRSPYLQSTRRDVNDRFSSS